MKHISIAIVAAILSLSATSCGLYGKWHSRNSEDLASIELPSYKEIFFESELHALIDTALARNYDLKMAHEHVAQADSRLKAARLAYLPHLFAGSDQAATYTGNLRGGNEAGAFNFASASWEIDIFGRLTNRKRIAKASLDEMRDYEQAVRSELIAAVAGLYFKLQTLDAQIEAADSAEVNRHKSYITMGYFKESGRADEAAVANFEASWMQARTYAKDLRLLRSESENAMRLLLCKEDDPVIRGKMKDYHEAINSAKMDSIDIRAVRIRPDVRAAEDRLAGAFYNVNLARANCCPSITISGTLGWSGSFIYGAVGGLLQPIFNSGLNISQLKVSKSQFAELEMDYASTLLKAGKEVNDAMAVIKTRISELEDFSTRVKAMGRALEATQLKMNLGRGTYLEVLTAQNEQFAACIDEIQNLGEIREACVKLYLALGGGKD